MPGYKTLTATLCPVVHVRDVHLAQGCRRNGLALDGTKERCRGRAQAFDEGLFDLVERMWRHGVLEGLEPLDVHRWQEATHDRQNLPKLDVNPAQLEHPGQHALRVLLVDSGLTPAQPGREHFVLSPRGRIDPPAPKNLQQSQLHQVTGENHAEAELGTDEADE